MDDTFEKDKKVHISWWRQVDEHGSIYPYIDLDVDVPVKGYENNMAVGRGCLTVRLWERSAEHSKMAAVLSLMEGNQENGACTSYVLGEDEVLSVMGWDKLPVRNDLVTVNIGKVWEPNDRLGRIVYPGEG